MAADKQKYVERALRGDLRGVTVIRDENGGFTFKVNGLGNVDITLETDSNGRIVKQTPVEEQTNTPNSPASQKPLEHGDINADGWAYVGVNEDGQDVFAKGYGVKKWKEAMKFAANSDAHLGSDHELDLLQDNVIDGIIKNGDTPEDIKDGLRKIFDVSGSGPSGWAWGSRRVPHLPDGNARVQRLSGGHRLWGWQGTHASTVLFRTEDRAP